MDEQPPDPVLEKVLDAEPEVHSIPAAGADPDNCSVHGEPLFAIVNLGNGPMQVFECGCEIAL